jgi:sugar transferase (PEP-CTERM system associated)
MGFQTVGLVAANLESGIQQGSVHRIFAGYDSIIDVVKQHKVTDLVVAIEDRRGEYPTRQMLQLRVRGCRIVEWQAFLEKLSGRIPVENLAPSFFIFSQGFNKSPIVQWARRCISFLIALFGLVALAPFMIVVAILIRSGSSGKVFYMQERVGLNGKPFMLIKFRSMRQNSEQGTGPQWAMENDPRITSVGKWIRKYRIDEIPQLINVLMGDLDLIGPRPERPVFVEKLEGAIPYYAMRHTVRPGVTGWAQVMFPYCGSVEESKEKLQYDLYYIKNMSIKLDLLIIIRTVKILILGRGSR